MDKERHQRITRRKRKSREGGREGGWKEEDRKRRRNRRRRREVRDKKEDKRARDLSSDLGRGGGRTLKGLGRPPAARGRQMLTSLAASCWKASSGLLKATPSGLHPVVLSILWFPAKYSANLWSLNVVLGCLPLSP